MASTRQRRQRVLVADDMESLASLMKHILMENGFDVEVARDGEQCLERVQTFQPDLILLDIMMPKLHGMDALKQIYATKGGREIGVIICSSKDYKSDQDQARELGVFDFVQKPFHPDEFLRKVQSYFFETVEDEMTMEAGGSPGKEAITGAKPASEIFLPKMDVSRAFFRLWGTRGSIPVAAQRYVHHGGNTSCMSIEYGDEMIIFDAGTGIRELGAVLGAQKPRKLHIFITHTHWDHIQGFPFFTPAYIPGYEIMIYGASGFGKDLKSIFKGQLDRDYFPVQMEDMKARLEFQHLETTSLQVGSFKIFWEFTHHPGATLGYKVKVGDKMIGYIPDNEFLKGYVGHPDSIGADSEILIPYMKLVAFMSDVDILLTEAQYTNEEYRYKIGWGHSSLSNACILMRLAGIRKWIIIHHDPMHDDEFLYSKLNLTKQVLHDMSHPMDLSNGFDGKTEYVS